MAFDQRTTDAIYALASRSNFVVDVADDILAIPEEIFCEEVGVAKHDIVSREQLVRLFGRREPFSVASIA